MQSIKNIIHNRRYQYIFAVTVLLLICVVTRSFHFGIIPGGVTQDESYSGCIDYHWYCLNYE